MADRRPFRMAFLLNNVIGQALIFLFFTVVGGGLLLVVSVHAASFDCAHASANVEQLICGDPQLFSKLDEGLAESYDQLLEQAADPRSVKAQQQEWLANVRRRCRDTACLRNAYVKSAVRTRTGTARGPVSLASRPASTILPGLRSREPGGSPRRARGRVPVPGVHERVKNLGVSVSVVLS